MVLGQKNRYAAEIQSCLEPQRSVWMPEYILYVLKVCRNKSFIEVRIRFWSLWVASEHIFRSILCMSFSYEEEIQRNIRKFSIAMQSKSIFCLLQSWKLNRLLSSSSCIVNKRSKLPRSRAKKLMKSPKTYELRRTSHVYFVSLKGQKTSEQAKKSATTDQRHMDVSEPMDKKWASMRWDSMRWAPMRTMLIWNVTHAPDRSH